MRERGGPRPPRMARWLLQALLPELYREAVLGDAEEEFHRRVRAGRAARMWYWKQVVHVDVLRLRRQARTWSRHTRGRRIGMRDIVRTEVTQALRVFRRSPGFVSAVVLTLAVGIGGTTAIFTLVNGLLLQPLPGIAEPDRVVALESRQGGGAFGVATYVDLLDFRERTGERTGALADLAAFKPRIVDAAVEGSPQPLTALMVTASYFAVVGVQPALGRFFTQEADQGPGAHSLAVLSWGLWQRGFAADPQVLDREIVINGRPYRIVGVTPRGFRGTQRVDTPDVFVPISMQPELMPASGYLLDRRSWGGVYGLARLADGATLAAAVSEVDRMAALLAREFPATNEGREYRAISLRQAALPGDTSTAVTRMLALLAAVVVTLWLVVCLNVSNLLLARSMRRREEMAVRAALGAGRARLGAHILLEFLAIAVVAGVAGAGVARILARAVARLPVPIHLDVSLDVTSVLFTAVLALLSAVLCALLPALVLSHTSPAAASGGHPVGRISTRIPSRVLVVAQVAVSVVLLVATVLFTRSLANLSSADVGFDSANLMTARVDPGLQGYDAPQLAVYFRRLSEAATSIPGVEAVALADGLPSTSNFGRDSWFLQNADEPERGSSLFLSVVSANYFATLGVPVAEGRGFTASDGPDEPLVVVINEAAARLVTARTGRPALGQRMSPQGPEGPFLEIVGIVGDSRTGRETEAAPFVYGSHGQVLPLGLGGQRMVVMLKTSVPAESVAADFLRVAAAVDPRVSVMNPITMERFLDDLLAADRLIVVVLGLSSLLAAFLVAVGVYGLLAYLVGQRTREFGIRIALGARAAGLGGLVVREALVLAGFGLLLGMAGALAATRLVREQLFAVSASDPGSLVAGALLIVGVTVLAAYVPARRAARADPVAAMRAE